jgi:hypothetical protein
MIDLNELLNISLTKGMQTHLIIKIKPLTIWNGIVADLEAWDKSPAFIHKDRDNEKQTIQIELIQAPKIGADGNFFVVFESLELGNHEQLGEAEFLTEYLKYAAIHGIVG